MEDDLVDQQSQDTFVAQGREDLLVAATGQLDRPGRVHGVGGAVGFRDYFGPTPRSTEVVTQEMQQQQQQSQQEDALTDDPTAPRVYRLEKQPIAQPMNEAREEAEDHDAISILTSRLNKFRKELVEMLWELRTFGLECHLPLYINFNYAYEIIGGEKMLNISCIILWCIVVTRIGGQQLKIIYPKTERGGEAATLLREKTGDEVAREAGHEVVEKLATRHREAMRGSFLRENTGGVVVTERRSGGDGDGEREARVCARRMEQSRRARANKQAILPRLKTYSR
ncbi:hypothetical protein LR48_Vigan05g107000 [Vigna angularis]|uniref:Uncharacterized protein n=1 Tax=Phaseolus angularis TaxID=3914 RepID=A0A0L9ULB2_PHAAN|nr:hypothetical protein LR48_Vigan05g107000 [Vigna angularis]